MANELTISASLKFEKGDSKASFSKGGVQIDVTGTDAIDATQTIGTSEEAIALGDVAAGGYMAVHNLDDTNYVELRPNTAVADMIKLKAGEIALFRLASDAVPYAIANTAACQIRVIIIDD